MVCDGASWVPMLCIGNVLILILLEYGLRPAEELQEVQYLQCLNPYSIGIWSATEISKTWKTTNTLS